MPFFTFPEGCFSIPKQSQAAGAMNAERMLRTRPTAAHQHRPIHATKTRLIIQTFSDVFGHDPNLDEPGLTAAAGVNAFVCLGKDFRVGTS